MTLRISIFFLAVLFSSLLYAVPYVVGDKIDAVSLHDQHEKQGVINKATRMILFSRDKKGGEILTDALSRMPRDFLGEQKMIYITDISAMPGLISKYIAIPSMQKKSFSILLDADGTNTANFPDKNAMATLIYLESLTITQVIYVESVEAVVTRLTAP
ncbi:MAG: hypothetical protein KZQ64_04095 [gamma proteobacterium symbiont of Bathyaustriella thionipta]|nr:hypothetical protein [gamma proteobacterium symbiont of Bathyaustriella thionipta]MCU7951415.1 hypothetical protein [gamma proteobacterium symbiont of Bathyaustriella thionipta]MCU7952559.1 hypothetical protein [gamma proteobacterium symbiont of Bathyaustriella thionipta]MCU7957967.1 hypothetical protein [gamma proteobacterium symbiont of Bathyaustriella thionipta]MCU7966316.1 hypothetical protein [gamma proteobacterium symbiont of Bathyaustriella thionipta]